MITTRVLPRNCTNKSQSRKTENNPETSRDTRRNATYSHLATMPPIPTALSFTSNFPVPAPMKVSGDRINNWEDYELATGLDKRPETIRLATLRSVMGKDCLQIFLNLKLTEEESTSVNASLAALEAYFNLSRKPVWFTKDIYSTHRLKAQMKGSMNL